MTKLLVAEDDPAMGALLVENLRMSGYDPVLATEGQEAKRCYASNAFALCILDVMLPKKDGFQLAREIRELDPKAVFMFLTAKSTLLDKKEGFKIGCDDYLTKPFEIDELLLRINAILERTRGPRLHKDPLLQFGRLTLDLRERTLSSSQACIDLTDKEVRLLQILVDHAGRTVTHVELLQRVWGKADQYHAKSMGVYLTHIRRYLRMDPGITLVNVHGHGYRLDVAQGGNWQQYP